MIKDTDTGEVIEEYKLEEYELGDCCYYDYNKLLNKENKYNCKCTKCANVLLAPYSRLFTWSTPRDSFNNKKFSII